MKAVMHAPETVNHARPMFGLDWRLHAWGSAHPVRFGVAVAALIALVLAISLGGWTLHHPLKGAIGTLTAGAILGIVFGLGAHGSRHTSR
jgi:hypothetical protein